VRVSANRDNGVAPASPDEDGRAHTGSGQNSRAGNDAHGSSHQTVRRHTPSHGSTGSGNRATGGFHAHWLGAGAISLPGQVKAAVDNPNAFNSLGAATSATMTAAEYLALIGRNSSKTLSGLYRGSMWAGVMINAGMDLYGLGLNATGLANHPDSEMAKWYLANSAVHTFADGAAMALMPLSPAIAFAPLVLPDFAEIGRAAELLNQKNDLEQKGQQTEANATGQSHALAALSATPVVNWFAPFYQNALTPDVEKFEHAHGNFDGDPAPAELPPGTGNNPTVTDYYANAMKERADRVAQDMTPFLRDAAQKNGKEYVSLLSHWPQTFCWPSSGKPMRSFDRSLVLTYSRESDTVVPTFFGRDVDGSFRAPPYNHDIALQQGDRHLFYFSRMLDPARTDEMPRLHE
jgi:hypothetical protein